MDKRCRFSVILPVYHEPVHRVVNLLLSLSRQRGVTKGDIEVFCVVNQSPNDGSEGWRKAKQANDLILDLPLWKNRDSFGAHLRFPLDVLDACSEISNVLTAYVVHLETSGPGMIGEALNRGLAETAVRFDRVGTNGVINILGADAVADDPHYVAKAINFFARDRRIVAAHAGVHMVFDPDTANEDERRVIADQVARFLRMRRVAVLQRFLQGQETGLMKQDAFINVLARAIDAAAWGGYPDWKQNEDSLFGVRARAYAEKNNKLVMDATKDFSITVALRDSDRTGASIKPLLERLPEQIISQTEYEELERQVAATKEGRELIDLLEEPANILWDDFSQK